MQIILIRSFLLSKSKLFFEITLCRNANNVKFVHSTLKTLRKYTSVPWSGILIIFSGLLILFELVFQKLYTSVISLSCSENLACQQSNLSPEREKTYHLNDILLSRFAPIAEERAKNAFFANTSNTPLQKNKLGPLFFFSHSKLV